MDTQKIYHEMGISSAVLAFCCSAEEELKPRFAEIEQIGQNRAKLDFDMDGAVIKVNDFAQRDLMGSTNKFPRWAIAFKYPPEVKETTLLIEVDGNVTLRIDKNMVVADNSDLQRQ